MKEQVDKIKYFCDNCSKEATVKYDALNNKSEPPTKWYVYYSYMGNTHYCSRSCATQGFKVNQKEALKEFVSNL